MTPGKTFRDKLEPSSKKRLLAIDGGGIRAVIAIEILVAMEEHLRKASGNPELVLADFFDYVAGTSAGAIVGAGVSLGVPMSEIRTFFRETGGEMFDRAALLERFRYKYRSDKLGARLREHIGDDVTLGSNHLRTLLLLVLRNASTDSPWPISNNPGALYNADWLGARSNLNLPLWQLVRASTAAPTFFPPEVIDVGDDKPYVFVDGAVTTYNNPAFLMFLMATLEPYRLQWPTGEEKMLVVSVGTGSTREENKNLAPGQLNMIFNAEKIPAALMGAAAREQDMLCRVFGRCRNDAAPIDSELGNLCETRGPVEPRLFSYVRYQPQLDRQGLELLGLSRLRVSDVQQMDTGAHIPDLMELGQTFSASQVNPEHVVDFL